MKKKLLKVFALMFFLGLFVTSCEIDLSPEIDEETAQDNAIGERAVGDVFGAVNSGTSNDGKKTGGCPDITYVANNMTIDFGESCVGVDGVTRSGKIKAEFNGTWAVGAIVTITFENYIKDGEELTGTIEASFSKLTPFPEFTVTATNMELTFADGQTLTWESSNTMTWKAGMLTWGNKDDDVWELSGTTTGTARNGKEFSREATDLLTSPTCKWFVGGTLELTIGTTDTYLLTFSETCGEVEIKYNGITVTRNF